MRSLEGTLRFEHDDLAAALEALLTAIGEHDRPGAAAGTNIAAALTRVDRITRDLESDAPAQLRHFLERRSYEKALGFLRRQ